MPAIRKENKSFPTPAWLRIFFYICIAFCKKIGSSSSVGLEQQPSKLWVPGSSPGWITKADFHLFDEKSAFFLPLYFADILCIMTKKEFTLVVRTTSFSRL